MRAFSFLVGLLFLTVRSLVAANPQSAAPEWSMNATIIEACSCPMFCQCYFNDKPAAHGEHPGHSHGEGGEHFCKFNNAYRINHPHYPDTKLNPANFSIAAHLATHFS